MSGGPFYPILFYSILKVGRVDLLPYQRRSTLSCVSLLHEFAFLVVMLSLTCASLDLKLSYGIISLFKYGIIFSRNSDMDFSLKESFTEEKPSRGYILILS